jgi:O-antigen/teichoic acid export membrane protein
MIVASGTALSQAISMAFTPLITRLYGPEAFGLQGIFTTVVGLATTIAALGYPTAILLPKSDADAKSIALLSVYVGVAMSILMGGILYIAGGRLLELINAEAIAGFMFLIPLSMIFSVFGAVLSQWLLRKKAFGVTARYGVGTTLLLSSAKAIAGFLYPTAMVLIVINTFGSMVGTGLTYLGWRSVQLNSGPTQGLATVERSSWQLAKVHRDFPLLRTPQNLINGFSQGLPILLLASFFGPASAGQYGIALSVLGMPTVLIGGSVMSVFSPRISEAINRGEDARNLIIRATLGMAVTGALPFLVILLAGPFLFSHVFGPEWRTAGLYAQLLAPWLFFQYINKPAVSAIPALHLQGGLLIYEIFSTGTKLIALWLGFSLLKSDMAAIGIFSLVGIIAYIWLILWVVRRSTSTQ